MIPEEILKVENDRIKKFRKSVISWLCLDQMETNIHKNNSQIKSFSFTNFQKNN
jgi:hypothetical protein